MEKTILTLIIKSCYNEGHSRATEVLCNEGDEEYVIDTIRGGLEEDEYLDCVFHEGGQHIKSNVKKLGFTILNNRDIDC